MTRSAYLLRAILLSLGVLALAGGCHAGVVATAQAQAPAQGNAVKEVGTIKAVSGTSITLTTDAGAEFTIQVEDSTRMARVEPGQTDLKGATVIHLADLQAGDRILVRGTPTDTKSITAVVIIAMKHTDVEAKQERERQDWQKRGIGGLVGSVDASSGTITITTGAGPAKKSVAIHTTTTTVFRRYAPDSVKFDDAKASSLDQVKPGDQLRARGDRNQDGTEFAAEEVVSGLFRNIAGTIASVDAGANTVTVVDLLSKKPVVVKITPDSQVRNLPERMAQFIAMRLKGIPFGSGASAPGGASGGQSPAAANGGAPGAQPRPSAGGGAGGAPDLQQMLNRIPPASIADLQKGDAVMIVSTEGTNSGAVTAITLLGGVEPILQAAPNGAQAMMLTPWSLGGGAAADDTTGGGSPQ
ncbi:MAG TPA: DUF5666 domain-containing protein [Candidatus Acidoferrum sp.]|nr:DUF5666 domain-containing protein [Candidatus Acidoferrum sp.]